MPNHKFIPLGVFGFVLLVATYTGLRAYAQPLLVIRDDPGDVGNQPNNESTYFFISDDIWVRRTADPNYDPTPFPSASPAWAPLPYEDPCYRDPKISSPNYIYVRIQNLGDTASSGSETLRVYWAKASTGLAWSDDWTDHLESPSCGGAAKLYGFEVTKPRKNGATATPEEKAAFVAAIQAMNTVEYRFGDGFTYWNKQNQIHGGLIGTMNNTIHNNPNFLPWHREFVQRFEMLLREYNPVLTYLYWDWTTDPGVVGPITGDSGYMGTSSGVLGPPFSYGILDPPNFRGVLRDLGAFGVHPDLTFQTDTLLPSSDYNDFWGHIEVPCHNRAHNFIGGTMRGTTTSASDPLFFMLHGNCDRLWALWQRQHSGDFSPVGAAARSLYPWSPAHAYEPLQSHAMITGELIPWNGGGILTGPVAPWTGSDVTHKTPLSHSLIYPPIYDNVPLKVPSIPAHYSCILEIPFYPPSPSECGDFVDPGHLCLLARIEPVGITEVTDLTTNVKNSPRIAWRNTTVSDCDGPGPWIAHTAGRIGAEGELVRNARTNATQLTLRFDAPKNGTLNLFDFGKIRLRLESNLYQAWTNGGMQGTNVAAAGTNNEVIVLAAGATLRSLALGPRALGHMNVALELSTNYASPAGKLFFLDVLEFDSLSGTNSVGGQRYTLDFNRLSLVQRGSRWRYLDGGVAPVGAWTQLNYNDAAWAASHSVFGFGRDDIVTSLTGVNGQATTAYFRQQFTVANPSFYHSLHLNLLQNDGLVVYLNGQEIARANMPTGAIAHATRALTPMDGAAARAYRTINVSNALNLLVTGNNLLTAEVHPATNGNPLDLTFDLELAANVPAASYQPPTVVITTPQNGGQYRLGSNVFILADVLDPDSDLSAVRIYTNNVLLATRTNPPFSSVFVAQSAGGHRISVEAQDSLGHLTRMESLFTVVSNLLPSVEMTAPANEPSFPEGSIVPFSANAADLDGSVTQVVFYVKDHNTFASPLLQVGVKTVPPYSVFATNLPPAHYMAYATATDDRGGLNYSVPVHFMISHMQSGMELRIAALTLANGAHLVQLEWDEVMALLEYSTSINGPWTALDGAGSPYAIDPKLAGAQFFRLRMPD